MNESENSQWFDWPEADQQKYKDFNGALLRGERLSREDFAWFSIRKTQLSRRLSIKQRWSAFKTIGIVRRDLIVVGMNTTK